MLLATSAVLGLSITLMWFRTVPIISADEIGYLGNARWLVTGSGPSMGYTMFYPGGYSLLLAPFEWLLHEPRSVYKAAMVINAIFVAATVPALVRIARDFGFATDILTPWLAGVVALWPAQFVQAYLALPEIVVRLCFLLIVIESFALISKGGWHHAVFIAALAIISLAMHLRMTVIIPLCLVTILVAKWHRQVGWGAMVTSVIIVVAGYFAIDALNRMLQEALWVTRITTIGVFRTMSSGIIADPLAMLARTFGHFWYQLASSLLMVALGAIVAMRWVLFDDDVAKRFTAAFILLAMAAVGLLGAASMLKWETLDFLIYGRYLDIVTPPLFWFGVLGLVSADLHGKLGRGVPWAATASILGGVVLYCVYAGAARGVNIIELGAFMPLYKALPHWDDAMKLFLIAPSVSVITGIVCFSLGAQPWRLLAALGVVVALAITQLEVFYLGANHSQEASTAAAAKIYAKANDDTIHLDRSTVGGHVYIHQFMLKMHFPAVDVLAKPFRAGNVATIGPSATRSVSGKCFGAIDENNLLVRLGEGDPKDCPVRTLQGEMPRHKLTSTERELLIETVRADALWSRTVH
jgi:hypothetical protein